MRVPLKDVVLRNGDSASFAVGPEGLLGDAEVHRASMRGLGTYDDRVAYLISHGWERKQAGILAKADAATVSALSRELRAEPTPQLDWSKVDFLEGVPVKVKQVVPVLEAVRITEPMIAACVLRKVPLPAGVRVGSHSIDPERKIIATRCYVRRGGSHRASDQLVVVAGDWVVTDDDGVRIVFSDAEFWKAFERVG